MTSYDEFTKDDLQEELLRRGLPTSGNKPELIARLEDADNADDTSSDGERSTGAVDTPVDGDDGALNPDGDTPTVATLDAGHEDQVPTVQPQGVVSPDEQPALSAATEWVDTDVDPADMTDTAKHLLDAADSIGADVEREVVAVGGGFRVSRRVADAAGL